jgi:hypothetical protein
MKKLVVSIVVAFTATLIPATSASAGSWCNNGTYSSNSGRGTCSYNGGVNKNMPSYSDPGSSSYGRNNGYSLNNRSNSYGSSSNGYGSTRGNSGSSFNNGLGSSSSLNRGSTLNNGFGLSKRCPAFTSC